MFWTQIGWGWAETKTVAVSVTFAGTFAAVVFLVGAGIGATRIGLLVW